MGNPDRISGIFWLCFALLFITKSYGLGLGTLHRPSPGFLFFWANVLLGIMSLTVLIRGWMGKGTEEPQPALVLGKNIPKITFVLISLFLYAFLLETLGFVLVTFPLLIFLLGVIEKKGWLFTVSVSAAVTLMAYLIFDVWLKSQLPKGLLEFLRI